MDLPLNYTVGLVSAGLLAIALDLQSLLVDLFVGGAALYVGWSLWRSWCGKDNCASHCHSCPATVEPPKPSPSSPRFPLQQL